VGPGTLKERPKKSIFMDFHVKPFSYNSVLFAVHTLKEVVFEERRELLGMMSAQPVMKYEVLSILSHA
jgi:hypothetical protein